MSPLSPGGFGRQLIASNASASEAVTRNGTPWEVVFLMRAVRSPHWSGTDKKPLPLDRRLILATGVDPSIPYSRGLWEYFLYRGPFSGAAAVCRYRCSCRLLLPFHQIKNGRPMPGFVVLSATMRRVIALLLVQSLVLPLAIAQQQTREDTRPRRTQPVWTPPSAATPIITPPSLTPLAGPEPTIRVALTTDARSAVISTTGHLMNASGSGTTLLALDTSRVRVDPRLLSPLPAARENGGFRVLAGGAATREEAEENEKEIQKITGEDAHAAYDTETKTWGMFVGGKLSREEAEELRARLDTAGIDATIEGQEPQTIAQKQAPANNSPVRLTARPVLPSREVVASSAVGRIFSSSAPVAFASDDEKNAPVRFNDRSYRGRIEVFTNLRGNLTVVNELGLEDYVRGVVANELSPGGYPAIEALKAQAVAARTYALKNRGQFMAQGFDILPTTRSQVYRGLPSENPLSTRAVDETRGVVATYAGEPINALYTSTCGGRTEDSEDIFNRAIPYVRGRECAAEGSAACDRYVIRTSRQAAELRDDEHVALVRDISLLQTQNVGMLPERAS